MELITIRQVSQDYGISRQMLCYYEEIGLIKSNRKDDYAYRVYDEEAIKRLQQIIILRKLQIPMKQIKDILNNQNAVTVIEIFKQNISELDEEITVLSSVKSILARLIDELQQKADIYLKLDLLNDKTMISLVDSLSFTKHKIKGNVSMEELNKAAEQMSKLNEKDVRVVYVPPATVACAYDPDDDPDVREQGTNEYEGRATLSIIQKFINDVDLLEIKPDARVYGWGDTMNGKRVYMMWVTIPDDLDVPAPLWKETFSGGLYLRTPYDFNHGEWMERNDYEWDRTRKHNQFMNELVNPFSLFDSKNADSETIGFLYADGLMPLRKIKVWSEDTTKKTLAELDKSFSHGKTSEIDLMEMVKRGDLELAYKNGTMVIKKDGFDGFSSGMETPRQFNVPLKIEMRAKTDSTDIVIRYARGGITFQDMHLGDTLCLTDISEGNDYFHNKCGGAPVNEFIDIEWIIEKDIMVVKANGDLRCIGDDYGYIEKFKGNPDLNISSAISVTTILGATITVEKLRITEI